jgi:hypothetical protein
MGNVYIWGGITAAIIALAVLAYFLWRFLWGKAEDLGAAEQQADSAADAREVERKMAQAQANRKTAKEYVDWARKQGEKKDD